MVSVRAFQQHVGALLEGVLLCWTPESIGATAIDTLFVAQGALLLVWPSYGSIMAAPVAYMQSLLRAGSRAADPSLSSMDFKRWFRWQCAPGSRRDMSDTLTYGHIIAHSIIRTDIVMLKMLRWPINWRYFSCGKYLNRCCVNWPSLVSMGRFWRAWVIFVLNHILEIPGKFVWVSRKSACCRIGVRQIRKVVVEMIVDVYHCQLTAAQFAAVSSDTERDIHQVSFETEVQSDQDFNTLLGKAWSDVLKASFTGRFCSEFLYLWHLKWCRYLLAISGWDSVQMKVRVHFELN